ncbi:hypothetical protein Tco_1132664 [Tanacetum coccineum]|uniref:Reverse transcriptase domain-containing protein n=1 Tax=Tanacetum coccineum TaxID=301880 RepID=A0ABQ5JCP5_9ASTR
MSMTIQSSVKDKILATSSKTSKVENTPVEMLCDLDQQMEKRSMNVSTIMIKLYSEYEYEIRYHLGKANVVTDALSRKERVKPRRVRAMAMTIQYGVRGMILAAQSEAIPNKRNDMAQRKASWVKIAYEKEGGTRVLYFMDRIMSSISMEYEDGIMDEAYASRDLYIPGEERRL